MQKRNFVVMLVTLLFTVGVAFSQNAGSGNPHGQTSMAVPITANFTAPPALPAGPLSSLSSLVSGTLAGTFNITNFAVQNSSGTPQLVAIGTLIGTLTSSSTGQALPVLLNNVAIPVAATGTCPVLSLALGTVHLNVLGLIVDIPTPINVNIVAQSGPGNLLGNLLCDVTNLLNGGASLNQIATALNQLLSGLGL